jgi:predicted DNA-binding protein
MHLRIEQDLKEKFNKICEQKSLNGSAMIRKWIEEFVEENEKPLISMDILDIVWRLNKDNERSIRKVCTKVADRLGYDEAPEQLFDDAKVLLIERAQSSGNFEKNSSVESGEVMINNENVAFTFDAHDGFWRRKESL